MSDFSNVSHFATIVAGCESINNYTGGSLDSSGEYAFTVLRLHAQDGEIYAGQEGMLDKIKAGAKNVKDWIMKLIAAIRDWMKGDQVKQIERNTEAVEKTEEFIEKAIKQPEIMKTLKSPAPAPTQSSSQSKPAQQAPANPASKLNYSPSKSKEENSKAMEERYNIIRAEIQAQGAGSVKRSFELFDDLTKMDSENIMKEHFGYIVTLGKPLDRLKNVVSKMDKDSQIRPTNFVRELNTVIKEFLDIFVQVNKHIETYAKRTDLDPEYDKKYFPFAAKFMQRYGGAINGLIKTHTTMATEFAKRSGIRQQLFQ